MTVITCDSPNLAFYSHVAPTTAYQLSSNDTTRCPHACHITATLLSQSHSAIRGPHLDDRAWLKAVHTQACQREVVRFKALLSLRTTSRPTLTTA